MFDETDLPMRRASRPSSQVPGQRQNMMRNTIGVEELTRRFNTYHDLWTNRILQGEDAVYWRHLYFLDDTDTDTDTDTDKEEGIA